MQVAHSDKNRLCFFLFTRTGIDDVPTKDVAEAQEKEEVIALIEHEIKRLMHIVIQQY
jgi:hypothetical protein